MLWGGGDDHPQKRNKDGALQGRSFEENRYDDLIFTFFGAHISRSPSMLFFTAILETVMDPKTKDILLDAKTHEASWLNVFNDAIELCNADGNTTDAGYLEHERDALKRLLETVSDLHLQDGKDFKADHHIPSYDGEGEGVGVTIEVANGCIDVQAGERKVWIEAEGSDLIVHAHDATRDEPVNIKIAQEGALEIDTHDYDLNVPEADQPTI
jgi:hypothetical protein